MSTVDKHDLHSWPRRQYKEGGGKPLLFFVVYGSFSVKPQVSRSKYRCEGIPNGLNVSKYDENAHPEVVKERFTEGYHWEALVKENPSLAHQITQSPECLVIRGEPSTDQNLDYMRDTVGFISYLLENGGVCVYDPQIFKWWSPGEWKQRVFVPDGPVPRHHVVILFSEEDDSEGEWFHTRGMRKFGRPDLSIHDVKAADREAVIDMLNRFIEMQAFGAIIPEGIEIKLATLPKGLRCLHKGEMDDPDFNNVHVEITWPTR